MKTVINVSLGGMNFTIEEDAYQRLASYLKEFQARSGNNLQSKELMEDIEIRIADIFKASLASSHIEVVNMTMVDDVTRRIGMPDGSAESGSTFNGGTANKTAKRFYRDPDDKKIAGVCSGLAAYLDIDVTLVRVIFLVALLCGTAGFWLYIIFWIIAPLANTAAQKCEMRGIEPDADNMRRYSTFK